MGCLGVHFALDDEWVQRLKSFRSQRRLLEFFVNDLEEEFFARHSEWVQETDKAWDGIHRSLTDGRFTWNNGNYPLNHVILGGERLYTNDDYILVLKTPPQVRDVAEALKSVSKPNLRDGYSLITRGNCDWETSDEDWEYTWSWFEPLCDFYRRAADANRYVLFSASQ
jgi:hypothetical protein